MLLRQATVLLAAAPLLFGSDAASLQLQQLILAHNTAAIRTMGRPVLPQLVRLYEGSADQAFKAQVAQTFYELGWPSPEAKQALMKDVHTQHSSLRLQVQWALGRVSGDQDVVDTLLA